MKATTPLPHVVSLYSPKLLATKLQLPLAAHRLRAGFPSPADDYVEAELDLNEFLIENKAATFFCRVFGNSMEGDGIYSGDIVVVDRSLDPVPGKIVVASVDGEFVIKRLVRDGDAFRLESASPEYPPLVIRDGQDFTVWGVVTACVRKFR